MTTEQQQAPHLPPLLWASAMIGDAEVAQRVQVGVTPDPDKPGAIKVDADLVFEVPTEAPAGAAFIAFWMLRDSEEWLFRAPCGGYAGPGSVIKLSKDPFPAPPLATAKHWILITTKTAKTACGLPVAAYYPQRGSALIESGEIIACTVERSEVEGCESCKAEASL